MKEQEMSVARVNWIIQAVLAALLGAFALLAANNDFDALCYIGCSTASQSSDAISIHRIAYEAMSRNSVRKSKPFCGSFALLFGKGALCTGDSLPP
jgi:hypothetical protein